MPPEEQVPVLADMVGVPTTPNAVGMARATSGREEGAFQPTPHLPEQQLDPETQGTMKAKPTMNTNSVAQSP